MDNCFVEMDNGYIEMDNGYIQMDTDYIEIDNGYIDWYILILFILFQNQLLFFLDKLDIVASVLLMSRSFRLIQNSC